MWIYRMFHLFVMTGTYYCPILHSVFIQLQELSQIKRDATAHYFHKWVRPCHSSYDLQLLADADGPAFPCQLGQIFGHVPQHVRTEASATLPQNVSALVNVEEEHPEVFGG